MNCDKANYRLHISGHSFSCSAPVLAGNADMDVSAAKDNIVVEILRSKYQIALCFHPMRSPPSRAPCQECQGRLLSFRAWSFCLQSNDRMGGVRPINMACAMTRNVRQQIDPTLARL